MRDGDLRTLLRAAPAPGEEEAGDRAWDVVRTAFETRERVPRRRRVWPVVAVAAGAAVLAAALSPPGRALLGSVREAIGVEHAAPALFKLYSPGRLIVNSDLGAWIVQPDGSKRLLSGYREASWSPTGRFVVATRGNELVALEPTGNVHWTLARPAVRFPRWGGNAVDTRIAYLSRGALRVVAGDSKGDHTCAGSGVAAVAPAWRPRPGHVVAFASVDGRVYVYAVDRCERYWRSERFGEPRSLAWSADGKRLLLVTRTRLVVFAARGRRPLAARALDGVVAAAFAPRGHRIAVLRARELLLLDGDRLDAPPLRLFAGAGRFTGLAWSPNGRWLLVAWREADQWVFVRLPRGRPLKAVADVTHQFESARFPRLAGWCCP